MTDISWIRPELLIPLISGHVVGDFILRSDTHVNSRQGLGARGLHVLVVALITYDILGYPRTWWWLIPYVCLTRLALDASMRGIASIRANASCASYVEQISWLKRNGRPALFVSRQCTHLLILILSVKLAASIRILEVTVIGPGFWINTFGPRYLKLLVLAAGFILATQASGRFLGMLLNRFEQETEDGVQNGGYWIGILERALIYMFILAGEPTGIGFLAAAKSVFRFGELKEKSDRKLAEYILIGTLMSFTCAMILGYAAKYSIGLIK